MGLRITRRAFPDCGEWTVWRRNYSMHGPLMRALGSRKCRRAKMLFQFPIYPKVWWGVFWTYGTGWCE